VSGVTLAASEPLTKGQVLASKAPTNPKGAYDFTLTAAPRVSNAEGVFTSGASSQSPPLTTVPPILALGSGLDVVTEDSTSAIHVVTGDAVLNTGYFRMNNGSKFTAPLIKVMKTSCAKATYSLAKCSGTICATTKVTKAQKPTCAPPEKPTAVWTKLTAPVPDPYATLSDPTPSGLHFITTCHPHTGKLTPGEYDCGGAPLTLTGNGTNVTLGHGIYIFDTGLQINGNATLTGSTVLIYLPCGANDPWVPSNTLAAACSEGFGVKNGTVTASPFGTSPYGNLWFWQNTGDHTTATLHGTGAIKVKTGVLYVPGAELYLSGLGTENTSVGAIIAQNFRVANSHVTVKGFS
jgi:hypothetical protein